MTLDAFLATTFGQFVLAVSIISVLVAIALIWADWTEPKTEDL